MAIITRITGHAEYGRFIKALFCGEPGSGKTLVSSSFPYPYFASAEAGMMSLARKRLPFTIINTSDELSELQSILEFPADLRENALGRRVDTIVIDTIDEIQRIIIRERLLSEKIQTLRLADYSWLADQMQGILRGFRNLDMNVVFTCHIKESRDDEKGKIVYRPALVGSIAGDIPGYVDLAFSLQSRGHIAIEDSEAKRSVSRFIQTYPTPNLPWVKDRSGKLPEEIEINFQDEYQRMYDVIFADIDDMEESEIVQSLVVVPDLIPEPATELPELKLVQQITPEGEFACESCGTIFTDGDQATLSRIKLRKVLCADCYKTASKK